MSRARVLVFTTLIVVLLYAPSSSAAVPVGDCQAGAGWPVAIPPAATKVIELVNAHRAGGGLEALAVSPTLTAAAEWKARHMAEYGYVAHDDPAPPAGRTPDQRIAACGYPGQALTGENIAAGYGSPTSVVEGWLGSPGHRANLERAEFQAVGVGVARSPDGTHFWAQEFGSVADAGSPPPPLQVTPALPPASTPQPAPSPSPSPPSSLAPGTPSGHPADRIAAVRVRGCRRARPSLRTVRCRLVLSAGRVTVRARLRRHRATVAQGSVRAKRAGPLRLKLRAGRPLAAGRAVLRLQVGGAPVRLAVRVR